MQLYEVQRLTGTKGEGRLAHHRTMSAMPL